MDFLMLVDNLRIKFHWGVYQVHLGGISGTGPLSGSRRKQGKIGCIFGPKLI